MADLSSLDDIKKQYDASVRKLLNRHRREIQYQEYLFRARWFIWRAALPVAVVSGLNIETMLSVQTRGYPRSVVSQPRQVTIWLARHLGKLKFTHMANVLLRDHTSVVYAVSVTGKAIKKRDQEVLELLSHVFDLEDRWASRK